MPPSRAAKGPARRPDSITSSFGLCCRGAALPEARRTVAGRVRRIASAFPGSGAAPRPYGDSRRAAPAACHARSGGMRSPIRTHRAAHSSGAKYSPRFGALENQGTRQSAVEHPVRKRTARTRFYGKGLRRNAAHGRVTYRGMRRERTGSAHAPTSLPQCGQYFPRKGRAFPQCGHRLLQSLYTAPASMTTKQTAAR